jgi:hypothetical protein
MNPATKLEDAIFLFDPLKSLSEPDELASFYVDRGSDIRRHFSLMLEKLALLEYGNDDTWCDVHPILLPEVERRARQSAADQ